ncbi:MAG TPA: Wzz/FepE/Etk N-terminal domain-containing protein, partial [Mycobacteriales bacterium]|nr:Wzz/FepE/Etk N-terminal domain-containing protein [Mycobacteriales bacterium]
MDDEGAAGGSVFHGVLRALGRRLWVIGLCVVVAGGAAYALSKSQTPKYSATAQLLLSQLPFESQLAGGLDTGSGQPQSSSPAAQGADPTQVKIASLPVVADRTAAVLGGGVSGGRVEADVSVSGDNNANFAYVRATDPDR